MGGWYRNDMAFDNFMSRDNSFGGLVGPSNLLGEDPRMAFYSFQDRFNRGASPRQRAYFGGQFQDVHNEFLGRIGEQLRQGQTPTQTFTGFMRTHPFQQRFAALPPSMRGAATGRFAPQTRFFF